MRKLLILTTILAIALLTLGIITSAFGACLGCPDWPLCYGSFLPPQTITAKLEYYHRLLAGIVGILSIIIGLAYYKKQKNLSILLIVLIISQILLGGLTVLLKMPFIISISHALFGILTYITLLLMLKNAKIKMEKNFWTIIFILTFVYYMWGSIVDKTASSLACENIFCISSNFSNSKVIIQFIYQVIGFSIVVLSLISILKFEIKKLIFLIMSILLLILQYLIVKSLLSVSMITLHYLVLISALSFSLLNALKKEEQPSLKTLEI